MFTWFIRIAVFCFMAWTMSIPGTECYIAPLHWSILLFLYWFATHPMHEPFYFTRTDRRR